MENMANETSKTTCLNEIKDLESLVYPAYFVASISTEKAAKILNMNITEFIEAFDKWLGN